MLLSLLIVIATTLIKISYGRVEATLAKVEATLHALEEHKTVHGEWRKTTDREIRELKRLIAVLNHKVFGHARADDTPSSEA